MMKDDSWLDDFAAGMRSLAQESLLGQINKEECVEDVTEERDRLLPLEQAKEIVFELLIKRWDRETGEISFQFTDELAERMVQQLRDRLLLNICHELTKDGRLNAEYDFECGKWMFKPTGRPREDDMT